MPEQESPAPTSIAFKVLGSLISIITFLKESFSGEFRSRNSLNGTETLPEEIETRSLKEAQIGDEVRIYDTGAYGASMRAKGYNSFPDAEEMMVD